MPAGGPCWHLFTTKMPASEPQTFAQTYQTQTLPGREKVRRSLNTVGNREDWVNLAQLLGMNHCDFTSILIWCLFCLCHLDTNLRVDVNPWELVLRPRNYNVWCVRRCTQAPSAVFSSDSELHFKQNCGWPQHCSILTLCLA